MRHLPTPGSQYLRPNRVQIYLSSNLCMYQLSYALRNRPWSQVFGIWPGLEHANGWLVVDDPLRVRVLQRAGEARRGIAHILAYGQKRRVAIKTRNQLGMGQNLITRRPWVLVQVSTYQGSMLGPVSDPQPNGPKSISGNTKAAAVSEDRLLLTFIHPGFDCDSRSGKESPKDLQ